MPSRNGPVHVATTRRIYKGKLYETHLLRRTFREGGKVKHETLGNLSHLSSEIIEMIRASLRGEPCLPVSKSFRIVRSFPHGHVAAILGTLRKIGLEEILSSRPCQERNLVVAMIAARIIKPGSKLATARMLQVQTVTSSLSLELGVELATEDDLYAAMDWLVERQKRIETKLAKKHLHDGTLVLYDVSSSYYTGTSCTLAKLGHDRDGKKGFPQIIYGLLCNAEGCPVSVEVFEGNTGDPMTLGSQIQKVLKRFGLQRVVFVGDRGMITSARIDEEMRGVEGLDWITALRAPAIQKLREQGAVQLTLFDQQDLAEITSPDYPGERLVICRNPLLAEDRARKRQELLKATEKKLNEIVEATRREKKRLKGKEKIALRVGKIINKFKVAKHFVLNFTDNSFSYNRNTEKINEEAALDGLYVIRTSVSPEIFSSEAAVRAYKDLSKVERAFRCLKTVDLKVRPIYHWLASRVRAHVFLCMLAYYIEWHMRESLAPILFEEEDRETAEFLRDSIVGPAKRSPKAKFKDSMKRTEEGYPVHSFQTLLEDLATVVKSRVRVKGSDDIEFYQITESSPLQRHIFNLLGLSSPCSQNSYK